MPFHGSWLWGFIYIIPKSSVPSCSGYLLLCNKSPQNIVAQNNHFILSHDFVGQKFRPGSSGQFLCSTPINSGHLVVFSWWCAGLDNPESFISWLVSSWGWPEGWTQLDSWPKHLHIASLTCGSGLSEKMFKRSRRKLKFFFWSCLGILKISFCHMFLVKQITEGSPDTRRWELV